VPEFHLWKNNNPIWDILASNCEGYFGFTPKILKENKLKKKDKHFWKKKLYNKVFI